jgi:hypothetical protein
MKKNLFKTRKHYKGFKALFYSNENGTNNTCKFNTVIFC